MALDSMRAEVVAEIERLNKILALLDGKDAPFPMKTGKASAGKRRMSASARKRIAAAQKARWAKWRSSKKQG